MRRARASTILATIATLLGPGGAAAADPPRPIGLWAAVPAPIPSGPASDVSMEQATFVICDPNDPQTERAMEQFIATG